MNQLLQYCEDILPYDLLNKAGYNACGTLRCNFRLQCNLGRKMIVMLETRHKSRQHFVGFSNSFDFPRTIME